MPTFSAPASTSTTADLAAVKDRQQAACVGALLEVGAERARAEHLEVDFLTADPAQQRATTTGSTPNGGSYHGDRPAV